MRGSKNVCIQWFTGVDHPNVWNKFSFCYYFTLNAKAYSKSRVFGESVNWSETLGLRSDVGFKCTSFENRAPRPLERLNHSTKTTFLKAKCTFKQVPFFSKQCENYIKLFSKHTFIDFAQTRGLKAKTSFTLMKRCLLQTLNMIWNAFVTYWRTKDKKSNI